MVSTVNELYLETRRTLRAAGVESPELEARLLLCHALGCSREKLLERMQMYVPDSARSVLRDMTARRVAGEPVAYITGSWEFCGLPMEIDRSVLIPRSDTEVLVETALRLLKEKQKADARILDLGCGSGCIGIALGHFLPAGRITAVDISPGALELTRRNIAANALSRRSAVMEADILASPPMRMGSYDLIVSNPPYIATAELAELDVSVKDYEPRLALDGGEDGLKYYRAILSYWLSVLTPSGSVIMELGEGQAAKVMEMMRDAGLQEVRSVKDLYGTERVVVGTKK
ncbi:MAG: peptide chain release factor N(5)-glutamine methyltransferase [Oscillospiraceae bacterium]|nr:peptide chain release factor N(5)-glutamine methyltransferase [Oscillospiraceae bacterium]